MDYRRVVWGFVFLLVVSSTVFADITYSLHLSGVDAGIAAQITNSVQEAVPIYNKYGSFNKHLNVYYNSGVPTAQANYAGTITFGGTRNTRVTLHEICHTMGMGTYTGSPSYSSLIAGGVWQGFYARKRAIEMGSPYADGLHGDGHAVWPWAMNYDSEDSSYMERIKCVRSQAVLRCDMGIMSYSKEAEHQVAALGETAYFGVESPTSTTYQWYKDGAPLSDGGDISGATRSTLRIANADLSDEGIYYCAATGAGETLNSRTRRLTIQGQVSQWDFENNSNDSIGSYDGTTTGSPAYTIGQVGQAIDLDGTDDYVTLPAGVADAEDITIATWVYWDGGNQWQRIFDFGASTSNYMLLTPRSGSNTLRFRIKDQDQQQELNTTQLSTNQWVHLVVTLRGDTGTLYVNGQPVASNDSMTLDPAGLLADRNYIGDSQYSADPHFNGRIDDFRIYNYALAGSEVWNLWGQSANNPPVFDADPLILPDGDESVAYTGMTLADYASDPDSDPLTFSKVSGPLWLSVGTNGTLSGTPGSADRGVNTFVARVTDSSGATDDVNAHITVYGPADAHYEFENTANDSAGTNHGTPTGSPAYTTGILGQAIDLDGSDDYVTLPSGIANTEDITVAAWVNWDGGGTWQRIFDFGTGTYEYMILTPNASSNELTFLFTGSGGGATSQKLKTTELAIGQWVHVAVTVGADTGKLYVNGQLKDINTAMTINPSDLNPTVNYIGKSQWSNDPLFNGRIDDFRIYDYALSDSEIAALNNPPSFTVDPISNDAGIELVGYMGQSLSTYVDAPGGVFSKDSGPEWLVVSPDGSLSGIPTDSISGTDTFTVRVENQSGLYDTATMTINIANVYSGVRGTEDLAGLAAQWLSLDCVDVPACDGADLDGDDDVTISDFSVLAHNWLGDEVLQLHLKFDETSGDTAYDNSIYWRPGTLVNAPTWDLGHSGNALLFDGTNDHVEVSGYQGIPGGGSRTCMAWVKTASVSGEILTWGEEYNGGRWVIRVNEGGQLRAEVQGGNIIGTTVINNDTWHHVAVVVADDGSPDIAEAQLYVDGQLETVSSFADEPINSGSAEDVKIGAYLAAGGPRYFQGLIDEVRIYNTAMTQQEIQSFSQ